LDADHSFRYLSYSQEVIFAPGALAQVGAAVARLGCQRLLLCTTGSAVRAGHAARLQGALAERWTATFDHVQPHVPQAQVDEVLALAEARQVDGVIGLGGGSPLGLAKAVAHALAGQRASAASSGPPPQVPLIAIPTTYAGSEMTPTYGVTRQNAAGETVKQTVTDPQAVARLVIYDPQLTLDLPPDLTASTGINALAHCIEALYSITRHPLSTAAALRGLRIIAEALPRCCQTPRDLEARSALLAGAHLAGASLASAAMGLHHGLCHVLGGTAGVPHGIANSIILPHAMRFNAAALVPAPPAQTWGQLASEALGLPAAATPLAAAEAAASYVAALIGRLGLPQQLRLAGVRAADLPRLAELAFASRTVQNNPKPLASARELEALLQAAW